MSSRARRACLVVPAAQDPVHDLVLVQTIGVAHDKERGDAPVYRVHAQMRREVVRQIIPVLRRFRADSIASDMVQHLGEGLDVGDVLVDEQSGSHSWSRAKAAPTVRRSHPGPDTRSQHAASVMPRAADASKSVLCTYTASVHVDRKATNARRVCRPR